MKKADKVEKKDSVVAEDTKEKDTVVDAEAGKDDKKAPKVKKTKEEKKAEKKEKKAAKKAQRKADRKNPEIKAQKRIFAIKCIAAVVCAIIVQSSISSVFTKAVDLLKAEASLEALTASSDSAQSSGGLATGGLNSGNAGTSTDGSTGNGGASGDASAPAEPAPQPGETDESGAPVKPADGVQTLEYFNAAINKVKTGASSVEQKSVTNYLASSPTIPSALNTIYKMLGGDSWLDQMLKDNSQGAATLKGGDIKAKFPVEGESYASKLTANDCSAATCTESNGIYTIVITTRADAKSTGHKHGQGFNPKAHNVILPSTVNDNIPGAAKNLVGEAAMAYPASTITVTIDAATGNVLTATYDLKWTISFTKMNAVIPLGTKSIYEIKW